MATTVGTARRVDIRTPSSAAKTSCVCRIYSFAALRTRELAFFAWTFRNDVLGYNECKTERLASQAQILHSQGLIHLLSCPPTPVVGCRRMQRAERAGKIE